MLDTLTSPSNITRRTAWTLLTVAFAILACLVMVWRWGGTIQDSQAYFDTARYLRGELALSDLTAPFPYRILVPALASIIPGDLRNGFALLNWSFVVAGAFFMAATMFRAGLDSRKIVAAGLLMILSLPTFWYAPYLLVDPGSIFARSVFVFAIVSGNPLLAAIAGLVGTAIREENILLIVWLIATRQISLAPGLAFLAAAGGWVLFVRWSLLAGLPAYIWAPNTGTIHNALRDTRSLISIAGTSIIILPLAALGWRRAPEAFKPLTGLLLLMALPQLYAAVSVRVEGRIIWGLYPFLVPFAVCAGLFDKKEAGPVHH